MKPFFVFLYLGLSIACFRQSVKFDGRYSAGSNSAFYSLYELTLHADSSFVFHFYQNQECNDETVWGKGSWTVKNGTILFITTKNDLTGKYQLNLKQTKARLENGQLVLYNSTQQWLNGIKLIKE